MPKSLVEENTHELSKGWFMVLSHRRDEKPEPSTLRLMAPWLAQGNFKCMEVAGGGGTCPSRRPPPVRSG
jgi:hypothetical protein